MTITAYCDGSCPVPHAEGGWAFAIIQEPEENTILGSGGVVVATNNTMELQAGLECMRALIAHGLHNQVCIIWSDSQYVVNGMQTYRHLWKDDGWRDIKNPELWKEMHETANEFRRVRFNWLKGHAGHYWNERVDAMAGAAMKQIRRRKRTV
jgi:ribonuclease HI